MFFRDTNKQTGLEAAGKAGSHPRIGKQTAGAAAGCNNIILLCSTKLCLLKHKPAGLCNSTVSEMGQTGTTKKYTEQQIQTNSRRMPSGAHTKMYTHAVCIPHLLMSNATETVKQTDKKDYRGNCHVKHWKM